MLPLPPPCLLCLHISRNRHGQCTADLIIPNRVTQILTLLLVSSSVFSPGPLFLSKPYLFLLPCTHQALFWGITYLYLFTVYSFRCPRLCTTIFCHPRHCLSLLPTQSSWLSRPVLRAPQPRPIVDHGMNLFPRLATVQTRARHFSV